MEINNKSANLTPAEIEQLYGGDAPVHEAPNRRNKTESFDRPGVVRLAGSALESTIDAASVTDAEVDEFTRRQL